jgi:hypothetical protein
MCLNRDSVWFTDRSQAAACGGEMAVAFARCRPPARCGSASLGGIIIFAVAWLTMPASASAADEPIDVVAGRHVGATAEAVNQFAEHVSGMRNVRAADYVGLGTGSQKRELARLGNGALEPWKNAAETTKASLPFKLAPHAMLASDIATGLIAPAMEGDYRGAMGAAVNMAVAPTITGGGASMVGAIGTGAGMAIGSFIPVVGTAVGGMVGGAVGTVAGGYLSAIAYDKYVKDLVGGGVEAGIAAIFDTSNLTQAMMARDAFLREQGANDLKKAWDSLRLVSRDFNPAGIELVGPGSTPYIVAPKPPLETAPPEQQAALPPDLSGLTSFVLNQNDQIQYPLQCKIDGGRVSCFGRHNQGPGSTLTITLTGLRNGNTLEMENFTVFEASQGCTSRAEYRGHEIFELLPGGKTKVRGSMTARQVLRGGPCTGPETWGGDYQATGSWQPN